MELGPTELKIGKKTMCGHYCVHVDASIPVDGGRELWQKYGKCKGRVMNNPKKTRKRYRLEIKNAWLYVSREAPDRRKLFPRNMFDWLTLLAITMKMFERKKLKSVYGERRNNLGQFVA